ncbi:Na+/H+ antiporter [Acetobacter sp. TBRC 12305]|uniref:Na+/H+ antiporter n=1 Tax=Acetobacter garciniae TaxID=2817435 RepID=A0A939KP65_9PROT|nr:Na+/H+ antiporter [Acetobacter garciniae]MBO1323559.1 Na+/H+ antiporter [Acetobacter garciniae]MBX0343248.1 Na+/H+ antiporter [Acetobacter garciniae]
MLTVEVILLLLWLAAVSSLLVTLFRRKVPQPLILIVLGVGAALCGVHVGLHSELFMFVFLPPLLFADAFRMPLREFNALRGPILFLAFGLVVLNTLVCGYVIHWIVPFLALPVCFTLAAALSPTDTVAVSSLIQGRHVPVRLLQLLSGEALFNDASGLVCFRFAMADALTGEFSYRQAFGSFLLVSLGGLVIGGAMAWAAARINRELLRRGLEDGRSQIVFILLLPFLTYAAAEAVECSGILAAVAGCMVFKLSGAIEEAATTTRLQANTVWIMISYVFNALIFLFLGLQLPALLSSATTVMQMRHAALWQYGVLVAEIYGIMLAMRMVGVWLCMSGRWVAAHVGHRPYQQTGIAASLLLTFAGVRGAVTLAAVLSLPSGLDGTDVFPAREAVVVIAAGVIVFSLLGASIAIPLCLRFIPPELVDTAAQEENMARQKLIGTALAVLRKIHDTTAEPEAGTQAQPLAVDDAVRRDVAERMIQLYESRLDEESADLHMNDADRANAVRHAREELALRLQVLRAERQLMRAMVARREINDQTEWKLQQELDYEEQVIHFQSLRLPHEHAS